MQSVVQTTMQKEGKKKATSGEAMRSVSHPQLPHGITDIDSDSAKEKKMNILISEFALVKKKSPLARA